MTIYLEDETGFFDQYPELYKKVQSVIERCLDEEEVPYEVEVSLTIVDMNRIHEINSAHRNIDRPTDVLSFPQIDANEVGFINWDEIDYSSCINYDTDEVMLGDIILCDEKAQEQAKEFGHSLEREVCFLVAHSMFHLLGYDHMSPEDERKMVNKQESVLQYLSISR